MSVPVSCADLVTTPFSGEGGSGMASGSEGDGRFEGKFEARPYSFSKVMASRKDSASTSISGLSGTASDVSAFDSWEGSSFEADCGGVGWSSVEMEGVDGAVGFEDEALENVSPFHIHFKFRMSMFMFRNGPAARMVWFKLFMSKAPTIRVS